MDRDGRIVNTNKIDSNKKRSKEMDEMVEVLGIISGIVIVFTVFSGLAMKYKRNQRLKIHKFAGYVAFALAICHGILAMFS